MSTDTREKLFVRLTTDRAEAFRAAIKRHGSSLTQQDVIEQLIENYLAHETEGHIRHLDGTICPISALLTSLANSVESQWRMLHGFIKINKPPTP